jgi:hypothetical protein
MGLKRRIRYLGFYLRQIGYELRLIRPVNIILSAACVHCGNQADRAAYGGMATVAAAHQVRAIRRFKPPTAAVKTVYLPPLLGLLARNLHGISSNPLLLGAPSLFHIKPRPFLRPLSATGESGKVIDFSLGRNFYVGSKYQPLLLKRLDFGRRLLRAKRTLLNN